MGIRVAGLWNPKARIWVRGRENLFGELAKKAGENDRIIWVHCASAGELEQGKPLIEALKEEFPSHKIMVSVFSPSGYSAAAKYNKADILTYLPADTAANAKRFIALTRPEMVVFVKYEFWYHHLAEAAFHHIPLLLVSAIFRKDQVFFKWYGAFFRKLLFLFRQIFVQDETSLHLLKQAHFDHGTIGGDTRFDRVVHIASRPPELPFIAEFIRGDQVIIAGSTWPDDEQLLASVVRTCSVKLIVAPHEINEKHLALLDQLFPGSIRYSALPSPSLGSAQVLIIDNMGMLSRLYWYATITYVGGGFNKSGIHNTLEAAVYGKPVFFGPNYQKFREARELIGNRAAFTVSGAEDMGKRLDELLSSPAELEHCSKAAASYVQAQTGATERIVRYIQEKRLLTN